MGETERHRPSHATHRECRLRRYQLSVGGEPTSSPTDSTNPSALNNEPDMTTHRSDWREFDSPSVGVVEAVAEVRGCDPTDLPPISRFVDGEAVDSLVSHRSDEPSRQVSLTFDYAGVSVRVDSTGLIEINAGQADDGAFPVAPRTDRGLSMNLKRLLTSAVNNDVSIEGGWEVRNGADLPDWDIHITQVVKPQEGD